jgi:hypothetical protein
MDPPCVEACLNTPEFWLDSQMAQLETGFPDRIIGLASNKTSTAVLCDSTYSLTDKVGCTDVFILDRNSLFHKL